MKIKCPKCEKVMKQQNGIHHFTESGLNNVYLENTKIYTCGCGINFPSIFQVKRLNDLIAEALVMKPSLLEGNEIKFLRKNIPISATMLSMTMGIDKSTLSKWENSRQTHKETNDRFIRTIYMVLKDFEPEKIEEILESLSGLNLGKRAYTIIYNVERIENDYIISQTVSREGQINDDEVIKLCFNECEIPGTVAWATTGVPHASTVVNTIAMAKANNDPEEFYDIFFQESDAWREGNQRYLIH